jgi:hypothetical protein
MLDKLEIHVHSMACQDNYLLALKKHDLMSDRIYQVYTRYTPGIYYTYTMLISLASQLSCQHSFGSLSPRLSRDLLSFGQSSLRVVVQWYLPAHREAAHARLGPSKVPQPGVDLVYMAAPPLVRARSIGTAALKSVLLSAAVLVWNS